jgi:hypothetical protein
MAEAGYPLAGEADVDIQMRYLFGDQPFAPPAPEWA